MSDWLAAGGVAEALDALAMAARLDPGGGFSFPLQCGAHPQTAVAALSREQAEAIEQYKRELQKQLKMWLSMNGQWRKRHCPFPNSA